MGLASFLTQLFESGRVRVPTTGPLVEDDLRGADMVLRQADELNRLDLPGTAPPLDSGAARWGAVVLLRACQAFADHATELAALDRACRRQTPDAANPSSHYSVDLTLRYLPDLITLARRTSESDPLVTRLLGLASDWPLSSVGIDQVTPHNVPTITDHPALLQLYVDRTITRGGQSRLDDERVREVVRRSLGLFPELAPEFAALTAEMTAAP